MVFLTDLDSRAAIKGNRDPLGVQSIWTRMGRRVVGNLTTVSNSVRDFTVTLLGYHFAEQVAAETGVSDDLNVFLRWEQLAAYARGGGNGDWSFRGTERARKFWGDGQRIRLGVDAASCILSDQKTYGLWGLYTVPSKSSGFLEGSPSRLTPEARRFVDENYVPVLDSKSIRRGERLVDVLARPVAELRPAARDGEVFKAAKAVLRERLSGSERDFYIAHLVDGGPTDSTHGGQRLLAEALRSTFANSDWRFSASAVRQLARKCGAIGSETGEQTADFVGRISAAEQLLAPCVSLFAYLQNNHDQTMADVAAKLREHWGRQLRSMDLKSLEAMEPELANASGQPESARRWLAIAGALAEGQYETAITLLIDQNHEVIANRGGITPWIVVREGKLVVKVTADAKKLPPRNDLAEHWIHSYFLDSLRLVTKQLEA
jgi:hypothetical protein